MSVSSASPAPAPRPRRRYAPRMPPEQRREQLIDAALNVILKDGYRGVSIEAIAREAGVTRPVVYDHFPNLARLLHALVEREEHYSLGQLAFVVPEDPGEDPVEFFSTGVRRFLDATALPATMPPRPSARIGPNDARVICHSRISEGIAKPRI